MVALVTRTAEGLALSIDGQPSERLPWIDHLTLRKRERCCRFVWRRARRSAANGDVHPRRRWKGDVHDAHGARGMSERSRGFHSGDARAQDDVYELKGSPAARGGRTSASRRQLVRRRLGSISTHRADRPVRRVRREIGAERLRKIIRRMRSGLDRNSRSAGSTSRLHAFSRSVWLIGSKRRK